VDKRSLFIVYQQDHSFNEESSEFMDHRQWVKLQWLPDPSQFNAKDLGTVKTGY